MTVLFEQTWKIGDENLSVKCVALDTDAARGYIARYGDQARYYVLPRYTTDSVENIHDTVMRIYGDFV